MPVNHQKPGALILLLAALGGGLFAIFRHIGGEANLEARVPEFVGLMLLAGAIYLAAVFLICNFRTSGAALLVILGIAVLIRICLAPAPSSLSNDVYRYQWEGRIQRAGINPYTVYPAMPRLTGFQNPEHPIETGKFTPTVYPPLSEWVFTQVKSIRGYKLFFLGFDLATLAAILLLLKAAKRPLALSLVYAWNPAVIVSFALSTHHDSLAVFTLVLATYFIITGHRKASLLFLGFSFASKLFSALMLPVFCRRANVRSTAIFFAVAALAYAPFIHAGRGLFRGLTDFARSWEGNDSLLRLMRWAGNSKAQAEFIAALLLIGLVIFAIRRRMEPISATLLLLCGLLFLSPNAFPWYFTWLVPFLCLIPNPPLLLMTVTCVLGYSPVITYAAGVSFRNQPLMLLLEYAPVFGWLAWQGWRRAGKSLAESPTR